MLSQIPLYFRGNDEYNNLIWLDKTIYKVNPCNTINTIKKYLNAIKIAKLTKSSTY